VAIDDGHREVARDRGAESAVDGRANLMVFRGLEVLEDRTEHQKPFAGHPFWQRFAAQSTTAHVFMNKSSHRRARMAPAMRLIPVIDIRQGMAVHGVGGNRERYHPVQSCLTPSTDPLVLLERLHAALRCEEIYVADLDALEGTGENLALVAALANHGGGVRLLVDAGVRSPADARRLLDIGVTRVVLASETSAGPHQLAEIGRAVGFENVVCSLDLRERSVVWGSPGSPVRTADDALTSLGGSGVRFVIILEMDRIGAETGVDSHFLAPLILRHRAMEILIGGGVRDIQDLLILRDIGAGGVLVATALHRGTISSEDLPLLSREAHHGPAQAGSW